MFKIIEFQQKHNLDPDGVIGKNTVHELGNVLNIHGTRLANFLGQLHHETRGFTRDHESFNYSSKGLRTQFSYYRKNQTESYQDGRTIFHKANQEIIANKVYWDVNRERPYWLGNKEWGDGWMYRGRGSIMTTGYDNYKRFGNYIGVDLISNPELVANEYYWESGLFFFDSKRLWRYADTTSIKDITILTEKINGGTTGLDKRIIMTRYYEEIIIKAAA